MTYALTTLIAFLSLPVFAGPPCGYALYPRGEWQAQQLPIDNGDRCFLKFSPKDNSDRYRSYNFSSDGQVMVFVGIGTPVTANTGAKTYYIWPAEDIPRVSKQQRGDTETEIRGASGEVWVFDRVTHHLKDIKGCRYQFKTGVDWGDKGGVDIESCANRLVLDAGFSRGKQTTQNPSSKVVVRDPAGKNCQIKARDFLDYSRGTDRPRPRYQTNIELYDFLSQQKTCRDLDLNLLLSRRPATAN